MAQQESMTLPEFQKRFATDNDCREHPYKIRWPEGLICPHCGGKECYKINKRTVCGCKTRSCRHQISLTAGTVMHGSHTPLPKWIWAVYPAARDKRGIPGMRLKREPEAAYGTAWLMPHKIRKAMEDRDSGYQLAGIVEPDETYVGGPSEGGKRGRGTEKTPVQAALSPDTRGHPKYVKLRVMKNLTKETIVEFVGGNITEGPVINTDGYASYRAAFAEGRYTRQPKTFDRKEDPDHLKRLHQITGNAKAFIAGTCHGPGAKHLQAYPSEFCFRANRRHFEGQLFNRLLNACMLTPAVTYQALVNPVPSG